MGANRGLLVVALCGVLFACTPVCADDKKPTEPEKFAVIGFPGIDPDDIVNGAKRLGHTKVVRILLFNVVLVWGTSEEVAYLQVLLRPL